MVLPVQGQTSIVDSTGINPWQGSVELKAGRIDPSLLPPSGGGATLLKPLGACMNFTNTSSTVAVSIGMQCNGPGITICSAYINGAPVSSTYVVDDGANTGNTLILPPLSTFTSSYTSCSYTAMANNVAAASVGLRWIVSDSLQWLTQHTANACINMSPGVGDENGYLIFPSCLAYARPLGSILGCAQGVDFRPWWGSTYTTASARQVTIWSDGNTVYGPTQNYSYAYNCMWVNPNPPDPN